MYKNHLLFVFLTSAFLFNIPQSQAEDLSTLLGNVSTAAEAGNYSKALEELSWVQKKLQGDHNKKLQSFFPDSVGNFSASRAAEVTSVMGMTTVERSYQSEGGIGLTVSLMSSSQGGQGGLGGLAAFGAMAAMMGGQPGAEALRIDGRTAHFVPNADSNSAELTISLDGGSTLKLALDSSSEQEKLRSAAQTLPVGDLENYLKGRS